MMSLRYYKFRNGRNQRDFRASNAKGSFPHFLRKTDQERVQNLSRKFESTFQEAKWEITEKLDGSSMTVYVNEDTVRCL